MKLFIRKVFFLTADVVLVNIAIYIALLLRFDGVIPEKFINIYTSTLIYMTIIKIISYYLFGLYRSLWKYASIDELIQIFYATATEAIFCYLLGELIQSRLPRTVYAMAWLITLLLVGGIRLSYRVLRRMRNKYAHDTIEGIDDKRVMIIGGGQACSTIIKQMNENRNMHLNPILIVDDDESKQNSSIHGVRVRGKVKDIISLAEKYNIDEIIIALPSSSKSEIADIIKVCKATKCRLKKLPGVHELLNEDISIKQIREVRIEDLLDREEVQLNVDEISGYVNNEIILVTGGGGSIGSELCRQIARFNPKELLIFDINENNAYHIFNELKSQYNNILSIRVIIGSIRDKVRLDYIFKNYRPSVVFHAAAHKHVPIMEENPTEAVKNNIIGTLNTVQCADQYGVKRFVLISSDKAVNPTNVMGATKRLAELLIKAVNKQSNTVFAAVRFGNVLGSNGSVIPLFQEQIARGGPVTVTHREITRYFMTIPEAAQLVIQAGSMAKSGEIFLLNMGESVKIVDLAKYLIELSGLIPDVDIKIEYIGLRPGEKLKEELYLEEEKVTVTSHNNILIIESEDVSIQQMLLHIKTLEAHINDETKLRRCLSDIVHIYTNEEIAASK